MSINRHHRTAPLGGRSQAQLGDIGLQDRPGELECSGFGAGKVRRLGLAIGKDEIAKIRIFKVCMRELGVPEGGAAQIGAIEFAFAQISPFEPGALKLAS